jgi:hypothetical protein
MTSCSLSEYLFVALCVIVLVNAVYYSVIFNGYCHRIAELENNEKGLESMQLIEGGGDNLFDLRQAIGLWTGSHRKYLDKTIDAIAKKLIISTILGIAAVAATVCAGLFAQFIACV